MPSYRSGPFAEIYADTTIPGTTAVAMTAFKAEGNSVILQVTTTTGTCGDITFTAEATIDGGATYGDVIDSNSVWSMVVSTPDTAGTYTFPLVGLSTSPGDNVRLSYKAAAANGKIKVNALCWDNPAGGGADISIGDIIADMGDIDTNTAASAAYLAALVAAGVTGSGYSAGVDASFVTGDSPATIDVNTALSRNGNEGWITNDGAGDFTLALSSTATPAFGNEITLKNGETFSFDGKNVDQFRITWVANSAYRYFIR